MADLRTSFAVLEDIATAAGLPLHKALAGDTATARNAHAALIAVDSGNLLQYLKVNAQGELIVSSDADTAQVSAKGQVTGSATFVDVATITLATSKVYRKIGWIVGCWRDAEFKIVQVNDMTTTDVALGLITGAGDYTDSDELTGLKITSGASGTQTLKIMAKNLVGAALSDFRATISAEEVQ